MNDGNLCHEFRVQNNENGHAIKNKGFVRLLRQMPPGSSIFYALRFMDYVNVNCFPRIKFEDRITSSINNPKNYDK